MGEVSLAFGTDRHLIGTLSRPESRGGPGYAVLLLNAGVIHRVGPHRFNVKLARELARHGIPSLRFDISGQGDSRLPSKALPFERQAVADLRAAMDHIQRLLGVERFVIAGICSGAQNALAAADEDPRVVGLWLLDAYIYTTPKTRWVRYRLQLASRGWSTLLSWAVRPLRRLRASLTPAKQPSEQPVDYGHRAPSRAAFADLLNRLTHRGAKVCLSYTGSMLWHYNYPEQLRDAFPGQPFVDQVRCDFLPDVDHTATLLSAQSKLIRLMRSWLAEHFP